MVKKKNIPKKTISGDILNPELFGTNSPQSGMSLDSAFTVNPKYAKYPGYLKGTGAAKDRHRWANLHGQYVDTKAPFDFNNPSTKSRMKEKGLTRDSINTYNPANYKSTISPEDLAAQYDEKSLGGIISGTASGAVTGLSVGGPWGAAVGGAIGLGTSLLQHSEEQDQLEEVADNENKLLLDKARANRTTQLTNSANINSNFAKKAQMEYGGFISYNKGQTHEGPNKGIPVDEQGNPSITSGKEPAALAEKGEIAWVQPDGTSYIFSEKLGFAKDAKKIMNRYKIRLGKDFDKEDSLARAGMNHELNVLKSKNEIARLEQTPDSELQLELGGYPSIHEVTDPMPEFTPEEESAFMTPIDYGYENPSTGNSVASSGPTGINMSQDNELEPYSRSYAPTIISGATGVAANLALAYGREEPTKISPSLVGVNTIDLGKARESIRSRGTNEKASARTLARKTGVSKAQDIALSNLASATIERNVGEQTTNMYVQEQQFNAQARATAGARNQQAISQTRQTNALRKDAFNKETNQYLEAAASNVTGAFAEANKMKQSSDYLGTLGGRSGYQQMIDPATGKQVLAPIPGYWERYNND